MSEGKGPAALYRQARVVLFSAAILLPAGLPLPTAVAQQQPAAWSQQEQPLLQQLKGLRQLPDNTRAQTTRDLAQQIQRLTATPNKLRLAEALANLSTEGDFGHNTLQAVADTLAAALQEQPPPPEKGRPAAPYLELAQLVRYEHVQAASASPQYAAAMAKLAAEDEQRAHADFTLTDLEGRTWTLQSLHGKVVLLNFWATWCPPCRKEMPDLEALYHQFKKQGLVMLGISDEEQSKVQAFVAEHHTPYPVLLDPGRKVNELFAVHGIPRTFIYNRDGKLAAQAIDMRTRQQFLDLLREAGLQ